MILFMGDSGFNWLTDNGNPYGAYNPKAAGTYATSTNDLSGNGRNIVSGNIPEGAWANGTGWTLNGSSYYARLPFGFGEDWTFGIKFNSLTGSAGTYLFGAGVSGAAPFFQFQPYLGAIPGTPTYHHGTGTSTTGNGILEGIVICSAQSLYIDGTLNEALSDTWVSGTTDDIAVGCRWVTVPSGYSNCVLEAFIAFDKTLNADEVDTLYEGMLLL